MSTTPVVSSTTSVYSSDVPNAENANHRGERSRDITIFDPDGKEIPEAPPEAFPPTKTATEMVDNIQEWAKNHGFAVVKRQGANKWVASGGDGDYKNYSIFCAQGGTRDAEGHGIRSSSTRKINCPWKARIYRTRATEMMWTFALSQKENEKRHNHPASLDPSAHREHRKLTPAQHSAVKESVSKGLMFPREIKTMLATMEGPDGETNPHIRKRDVYNLTARIRKEARGGRTPTQRLFSILQEKNLPHYVKWSGNDGNTPEYIFWSTPRCIKQWKRFPEVLGWDCTYKTNRFDMPFLQVTITTDTGAPLPVCWAFLATEKSQGQDEGYNWVVPKVKALVENHGISEPLVHMTDYEQGLKKSLAFTWPSTQQQLCIFHINKNVGWNIKRKWIPTPDDDGEEGNGLPESAQETQNEQVLGDTIDDSEKIISMTSEARELNAIASRPVFNEPLPNGLLQLTRKNVYVLWRHVMYGETVADFEAALTKMHDTFSETQKPVLQYLDNTYLLYAKQWARCYIKHYRNFGLRTGSPTETVHHQLKSYLTNSRATIDMVYEAVEKMLDERFNDYTKQKAQWQGTLNREMMDREWLGNLRTSVVFPALKKIVQQYQLYKSHEPSRRNPKPPPPQPCTKSVMQQYALPCSHQIKELLATQSGQLKKENVHPRWWLQLPLDDSDPLLRINDPAIKNNPVVDVANKKDESLRRLTSKRKRKQSEQAQLSQQQQPLHVPTLPFSSNQITGPFQPSPSLQINFAVSSSQSAVPLPSTHIGPSMSLSQLPVPLPPTHMDVTMSSSQPHVSLPSTQMDFMVPMSQAAVSFQQSPLLQLPKTTNTSLLLGVPNALPPRITNTPPLRVATVPPPLKTINTPLTKVATAPPSPKLANVPSVQKAAYAPLRPIAPSLRRRISHDEFDIHHPFQPSYKPIQPMQKPPQPKKHRTS